MYGGRWVARCPRVPCMNAEQFGRCHDGNMGGLEGEVFRCRDEYGGCGLTCPADWPPNVADVERLVLPRPVPATRNWLPGESLFDLMAENLEHGLIPPEALKGGETRQMLSIADDKIEADSLGYVIRLGIEGRG